MNKRELINKMVESGEYESKAAAERALTAVLNAVRGNLSNEGDKVRLTGLGVLEVRSTRARNGRNPRTGEPMKIKARKRVYFRPSKVLAAAE